MPQLKCTIVECTVALSTFTTLCNRHYCLLSELAHHLKQKLCTHSAIAPHFLLGIAILSVSLNRTTLGASCKRSVSFGIWLTLLSIVLSRFICVVACVCTSFLFKAG